MGNIIIGSYSARVDKGGRLKIPETFRLAIEGQYGKEVFITSLTDNSVQIYPLPVWESLAMTTKKGFLHLKPDLKNFLLRVNIKGTHKKIDSKGRVLINPALREKADLIEEVEVIGLSDHIEIWNKDRLEQHLEKNPLTDKDFERIADLTSQDER